MYKSIVLISSSILLSFRTAPEKYDSSDVFCIFSCTGWTNHPFSQTPSECPPQCFCGRGANQRGWEGKGSAGPSREARADAAFEFHAPFGVTWTIGKINISCQRISTICKVEECNAGNDGLEKALIMGDFSCIDWGQCHTGRVMQWGQDCIYGTVEHSQRAHPLSPGKAQWEMRLLQFGEGKGKSNAVSQGLLRLLIRVPVDHCPITCAWLRTAGRIILITSTVMVTICHWHPPYLLCSLQICKSCMTMQVRTAACIMCKHLTVCLFVCSSCSCLSMQFAAQVSFLMFTCPIHQP